MIPQNIILQRNQKKCTGTVLYSKKERGACFKTTPKIWIILNIPLDLWDWFRRDTPILLQKNTKLGSFGGAGEGGGRCGDRDVGGKHS